MATIEYYFVRVKEVDSNNHVKKDFSNLLKKKVDSLNIDEKYCENKSCSAILAEYIENDLTINSITFDFTKLTSETVTSALKYNLLENIDTFKELDEKTMRLIEYTKTELESIKSIINSSDDIKSIIKELEETKIDFFKTYKIIDKNNINKIINNKSLLSEFYKKYLKRFKKDKTFFNTFSFKNKNILQFQKNIKAFDIRKFEQYINNHLLFDENLYVVFEKIYDSEFLEMLKDRELSLFEIKYHSTSKSTLLNKDLTKTLFQVSNYFGTNTTKISAKADDKSSLSNEKVLEFFESVNELGILDECKVRPLNSRSSVKSTDKGSSLKYITNLRMETLDMANRVFLDACDRNIAMIEERII